MRWIAIVLGAALALVAGGPARGQSAPYLGASSGGASSTEVTSGNRFNPDISLILEGNAYHDDADGDELVGMAEGINPAHAGPDHGHAPGGEVPGFNLKPTELFFSASVDPYFDAFVQAVLHDDGGVGLEEAYFTTRALPAGLRVKGGKLLSGIGYHNEKHRHQWQFIEQNLPYQYLLGAHGLMDTGVQLTWTPATPFYTRFGVEALQGDQPVVGRFDGEAALEDADHEFTNAELDRFGEPRAGPRLFTAFIKAAPNLGYSHELRAGVFGVYASGHQELHTDTAAHLLTGEYWVAGTDWVYAYDAPHQYGRGDLKLSAEYLYAVKELEVAYHEGPVPEGDERTFREDGFYVQGRYGFAANWRVGARYDMVGLTNEKAVGATGVPETFDASRRVSVALTWTPTHFTRLQAQWSRAGFATADGRETANQYYLRYILSMGQHGAHDF